MTYSSGSDSEKVVTIIKMSLRRGEIRSRQSSRKPGNSIGKPHRIVDSLAAMGCCYWIQDGNNDNNQDNDIIKINPLFGSGGSLLFWLYCDFLLVPIKCYANDRGDRKFAYICRSLGGSFEMFIIY